MSDTNRPQISRPVDVSLRDRIAAAIAEAGEKPGADQLSMADAVIAELGLTRVTRSERVPIHRYVTEWEKDEAD